MYISASRAAVYRMNSIVRRKSLGAARWEIWMLVSRRSRQENSMSDCHVVGTAASHAPGLTSALGTVRDRRFGDVNCESDGRGPDAGARLLEGIDRDDGGASDPVERGLHVLWSGVGQRSAKYVRSAVRRVHREAEALEERRGVAA